MKLAICVATMQPNPNVPNSIFRPPGDILLATSQAVTEPQVYVQWNTPEHNLGVAGSYDKLYRESTEEILCFLHDDVIIREHGWDARVLKEFEDEQVGLVGFGGALWHGDPDLYKLPYQLQRLRRGGYRSNVDDAEVHGERFTGSCRVSVLDGFNLICRRRFLDRCGGFSWIPLVASFFCYDYAISAMARRLNYHIRCVGVRCHHRGGVTSTQTQEGITGHDAYNASHYWLYNEFRDVLPAVLQD